MIQATVREKFEQTITVPNMTRRKLHYHVESDLGEESDGLGTISGPDIVTVLPGQTDSFPMAITPMRRGRYTGVLAFVAGDNPTR